MDIIGSWVYDGSVAYTYVFEKDGSGKYLVGDMEMEFTYVDNGDSVEILYSGNTEANTFKYEIKDGKLLIEDSFGDMITYVKK